MIIRQQAFGGAETLLKGGLHCHTTRSDGKGAPDEVIRLHHQNGYDFLAVTDHNCYNYQNFAPEVPITILPGMERDHRLTDKGVHVFHTVVIGPEKDKGNGYSQDERFQGYMPVSGQDEYQAILDDYHAHGNLTIYCHPEWSNTPAREFERLRGNFAMEIWNSGCAMENHMDMNANYWDELLMQGNRIFGVAVDDGHAMKQHCKGWVRVRAKGDIGDILRALSEGAFYSSCGPEILDFYIKDDIAVLECSPCASAGFRWGYLPTRLTHSAENDVTRVEIQVQPHYTYLRGVVTDAAGRRAWTNPIFLP